MGGVIVVVVVVVVRCRGWFDDLWGDDPQEVYVRTEPEKRHGDDEEDNVVPLAFDPPPPVINTIVQRHKMIVVRGRGLRDTGV